MPDFSLSEADQEFIGDPADKTDQAAHRKRLGQLELQQQLKKVTLVLQPPLPLAAACPFSRWSRLVGLVNGSCIQLAWFWTTSMHPFTPSVVFCMY